MNVMQGLPLVQRHCERAPEYEHFIIHIKNIGLPEYYIRISQQDNGK